MRDDVRQFIRCILLTDNVLDDYTLTEIEKCVDKLMFSDRKLAEILSLFNYKSNNGLTSFMFRFKLRNTIHDYCSTFCKSFHELYPEIYDNEYLTVDEFESMKQVCENEISEIEKMLIEKEIKEIKESERIVNVEFIKCISEDSIIEYECCHFEDYIGIISEDKTFNSNMSTYDRGDIDELSDKYKIEIKMYRKYLDLLKLKKK
jgi:hypothetical protein